MEPTHPRVCRRAGGRRQFLALPRRAALLPIACAEGWSTADRRWSGLLLAGLARLAGLPDAASVLVESVRPPDPYSSAVLRVRGNRIRDPRPLLALRVNGADLSIGHG